MRYRCNECNHDFHVNINTIFHHTKFPLKKWFLALSLILNAKKDISSYQLAKDCGLTQPTSLLLSRKIRMADTRQRFAYRYSRDGRDVHRR